MPKSKPASKYSLRKSKKDSDSESDSSSEGNSDYISSDEETDSTYMYESTSSSYLEDSEDSGSIVHKKKSHRKKNKEIEDADESMEELHKTLYKLFPSNYSKEKMEKLGTNPIFTSILNG